MKWRLLAPALVFLMAPPAIANSDFSEFPHWRYVLDHEKFTPPARTFTGDLKPILDRMHEKYRHVPYRRDFQIYGEWNHWATRRETKLHGAADCKGIAEAELFDLLEMGIPDEDVELVVASIRKNGELHAVTRVRNWILDIRAKRVLTLDEFDRYYQPIFSINRIGWKREGESLVATGG